MKNIRDSYIKIRTAIGNEMKDASVHGSLQLYAMDLCGYNLGGDAGVVLDTVHELNDNLLSLCDFYEKWNADILLPQVGAKGRPEATMKPKQQSLNYLERQVALR